jgi:plasmid stability protein
MQYTIRGIPPALDTALRQRARRSGKSLNETALDALRDGVGLSAHPKRRDLSDLLATWKPDAALEEALADQDRIDPDLWQ